MRPSQIVVVTGASGVGKTTLVRALEGRRLEGVRCYYFDSIGVPSTQAMTAEFGSPGGWQEAMTRQWIARLAANEDQARVAVLDGQVRPTVVRAAFTHFGLTGGRIVLVDCSHDVRETRLRRDRQQPELASRDMAAWAAYLRGQADALDLPIVDTTDSTVEAAADQLLQLTRPT
jgi:energy-coupling factor transporter ATP-binding protein EcfA2